MEKNKQNLGQENNKEILWAILYAIFAFVALAIMAHFMP